MQEMKRWKYLVALGYVRLYILKVVIYIVIWRETVKSLKFPMNNSSYARKKLQLRI